VCITGGGFKTGDRNKWSTNTWAKVLASHGFVAVTIDYRLEKPLAVQGNETQNQDSAYDAKAAVRWLVKNADKYKISTDHIIAFGSSAGGMTVAWMVGVHDGGDGDSGNPGYPSNITAGISLSGFLWDYRYQGLRADEPPFLDFHGTSDHTVPIEAAELTVAAMRKASALAGLVRIPSAGHVPWNDLRERTDDFIGFVSTYGRLGELQCPKKAQKVDDEVIV
jgi:acetyl esterase/lipase